MSIKILYSTYFDKCDVPRSRLNILLHIHKYKKLKVDRFSSDFQKNLSSRRIVYYLENPKDPGVSDNSNQFLQPSLLPGPLLPFLSHLLKSGTC